MKEQSEQFHSIDAYESILSATLHQRRDIDPPITPESGWAVHNH
jgi:hypothetical protein